MNVLILGGTGAMGEHLVQLLANNGTNVFVTTRQNKKSNHKSITYIQGNAHDMSFLGSILKCHYDAIVDFLYYSTEKFTDRYEKILNSCSHYVFLSSSRVYSQSDYPIKESFSRLLDIIKDEKYLETDEYALAKAREEDILNKSKKRNWTIIRPYITFSNKRLQLGNWEKENFIFRCLHGRSIVLSEDIALKETTFTYGLDVANAILSILNSKQSKGEIYHITTDETLTWKNVLEIYKDEIVNFTQKPIKIKMIDNIHCLFKKPEPKIVYDRLYNRIFDNAKIKQLGVTFTGTEQNLRQCIRSFLINPQFDDINWQIEARLDKISGEIIKDIPELEKY